MVGTRSKATPSPSKRPTAKTPSLGRKNKVVATKPPKSPHLKSPGLSETADDSSVLSIASSTASRPGLSFHIQKQLATDIESNGGIGAFHKKKVSQDVCKFLDTQDNPIYGKRGDPRRSQIQQHIKRWKRLDREGTSAERVLNRFQVKSAANLRVEQRAKKTKGQTEGSSSSSSSGTDNNSSKSKSSPSSISSEEAKSKETKTPKAAKRKTITATKAVKQAPKKKVNAGTTAVKEVATQPVKSISFRTEEKEEMSASSPPKIPHSLDTGMLPH